MRVFNPHAPLNKHSSLNASCNRHEREIKRTYERDAALLVHTPRPLRHWWVGKRGHNKDWLLSSHANRTTTSKKSAGYDADCLSHSSTPPSSIYIRGTRSSRANSVITPPPPLDRSNNGGIEIAIRNLNLLLICTCFCFNFT